MGPERERTLTKGAHVVRLHSVPLVSLLKLLRKLCIIFFFLLERPTNAPVENSQRGKLQCLFGCFFNDILTYSKNNLLYSRTLADWKLSEREAFLRVALSLCFSVTRSAGAQSCCCWCRVWDRWSCCRNLSTRGPVHLGHPCSWQSLPSPLTLTYFMSLKTLSTNACNIN